MNEAALENAYDDGVKALGRHELEAAREQFGICIEAGYRLADAFYLMGACAFLEENESATDELLSWSKTAGVVSSDFFGRLGQVIAGLGPDKGEALRKYLHAKRQLPRQFVGTLVAGDHRLSDVEPWYFSRDKVNVFPSQAKLFDNPREVIEKYIVPGFLPAAPLFTKKSALLTMGSCFAEELRRYLAENGMRSHWVFVPPGLNNTFALRNFVEWSITGNRSSDAYWYDESESGGAIKWTPDAEQQRYREVFEKIEGLVLTVGLAELWYDTITGGVFWRGVPKSLYDPERHKCRLSSVAENTENLRRIIELVHSVRPEVPIILTLSPVPLRATFEPISCFAADCVSKSTLRVAIDEVMRCQYPNVSYWPSFEIVRWLGGHLPISMYGDDGNTRHVTRATVRMILDSFIRHYYSDPGLLAGALAE